MKKYIFLAVCLLTMNWSAMAQQGKRSPADRKSRMENYQIAFITERLNLTPEESQKFWPIHNQYRDLLKKARQDARGQKVIEDMSDSEAEQHIKTLFEQDERELDLKKEYAQKLKGIISSKKIAKLQELEKEFKRELLQKAKERREKQ